jgi:hypothetical protein
LNGAIGLVRQSNSSTVIVKRLKFETTFDTSQQLIGLNSGVTANLVSISEIQNIKQIGLNSEVSANVQTGTGSVVSIEVVDSGFGYLQNETASFAANNNESIGTARISLGKRGVSEGFYSNRKGFISSNKFIFDGEYYQDYSYEVRTAVTADKYAEMLKNVLHVAGTKTFYAVVLSDTANTSTNILTDITEE